MTHGMFGWVDVSVRDLETGEAFYTGLFGWEAERMASPDGASDYVMFRNNGKMAGGMVLLSPDMGAAGVPPMWNSYVLVDDVEPIATRAAELGATVLVPPMDITDAGRMTYIQDPQGAALGFWQPGTHRGAEGYNETGFLTWNELTTRDVAGSKEFYAALMPEWSMHEREFDGGFVYTTIKLGDRENAGVMEMGKGFPPEVPTNWGVYFVVDDAYAGAVRVKELGGTVIREVIESSFGPIAPVADRDGAVFMIIGPMSAA